MDAHNTGPKEFGLESGERNLGRPREQNFTSKYPSQSLDVLFLETIHLDLRRQTQNCTRDPQRTQTLGTEY